MFTPDEARVIERVNRIASSEESKKFGTSRWAWKDIVTLQKLLERIPDPYKDE